MSDLYKKLATVQQELHAPKDKVNRFGNYNYRSLEGILEAIKPILARQGLSLILQYDLVHVPVSTPPISFTNYDAKGQPFTDFHGGDRFYIKATATVVDIETGDSVASHAHARESFAKKGMDDSQITGATSSYAGKYALNALFNIDDTKDADTDEYQDQIRRLDGPRQASLAPADNRSSGAQRTAVESDAVTYSAEARPQQQSPAAHQAPYQSRSSGPSPKQRETIGNLWMNLGEKIIGSNGTPVPDYISLQHRIEQDFGLGASLDTLTGGREGTASQFITQLINEQPQKER